MTISLRSSRLKIDTTNKVVTSVKPVNSPVKTYTRNKGRNQKALQAEYPEWNFAEIGRLIDVESFVRRAFRAKTNLFFKEGFGYSSLDKQKENYISTRFKQMGLATKKPMLTLMVETFYSLVSLSNAFWVKVRKQSASGGKVRYVDGKPIEPVAGYFMLPVESVKIVRDEYDKVVKYIQEIPGKDDKEFNPEDVIHFYFNRRPGFSVGTPDIVPVVDDIESLRLMEENIELLMNKHIFPLFHYKVGTKERPAVYLSDGTSEVDDISLKVQEMPSDGCWVTSERHEVIPLSPKGSPVDIPAIIEYWKNRIYTGLGVSSVDMGESGATSRSTAQTLSTNLINEIKAYQTEFVAQFNQYVIYELLLESTFPLSKIFDETPVELSFKEIDFENLMARENHYIEQYNSDAITHDELREKLGYSPLTGEGWIKDSSHGDFDRTRFGLQKRYELLVSNLKYDPSVSETPPAPVVSGSSAENKSSSSAKTSKAVSNKNKPQNQHGTRKSAKVNKDSVDDVLTITDNPISQFLSDFVEKLDRYPKKDLNVLLNVDLSIAHNKLVSGAKIALLKGSKDKNRYIIGGPQNSQQVEDHIFKVIERFRKDVERKINIVETKEQLRFELDVYSYRARLIDETEIKRAYNYGVVLGYRSASDQDIIVNYDENSCERCKSALPIKKNDAIIYNEIAPIHPECNCSYILRE